MKKTVESTHRIIVNPRICFGKPVFRGTRIPVHLVLELLEVGYTPQRIQKDCYPQLTLHDIQAALHYAASLLQNEELALTK